MSIKKLFQSTEKNRNYLSDTTQQEAFKSIESADNLEQINELQQTYVPGINYSNPASFAKFGSAYLYYKSSLSRILDFYPYDGSDAEKNAYHNKSLPIDKYIYDNLYPRTTGYISMSAEGWGTQSSISGGYGVPATEEYITFFGGPGTGSFASGSNVKGMLPDPSTSQFQYANIYDTSIYTNAGLPSDYASGSRESNLKSDFDTGVTVEFWLKTGSLNEVGGPSPGAVGDRTLKQVVFDMWNNEASSSADYGRITIELTGAEGPRARADGTTSWWQDSPFLLTVQSGSTGGSVDAGYRAKGISQQKIGLGITTSSLGGWHHYAITIYNSGSNLKTDFYVDGRLNEAQIHSAENLGELTSKNMMGRLGALQHAPSGAMLDYNADLSGAGKLSGSLDEFRFWKERRSAQDIGRYWFTQVGGGVNTDLANASLGVYYKFNEGITANAATDSVVLDYGGRICNGVWTGYTATSRNTGSAIVSASAAATEYRDPIIRPGHPTVANLKTQLLATGSSHDNTNGSMFVNNAPSWVLELNDDTEASNDDLRKLSHIVGTYFDQLFLQIQALPKIVASTYPSSSHKPLPFAQHLPQSLGLYTPELFIDATVMEKFTNRNDSMLFENDLTETKNLIYTNLYNNLASIYKNKGTEKAVRNVLRCFNVDEKLLRLKTYATNTTFPLKNNLQQTTVNKTFLNFHNTGSLGAVVYQRLSSSNPNSSGYLSGSGITTAEARRGYENRYGFTVEADITFPRYTENSTINRTFLTSSLFGMYTVNTGSIVGAKAPDFNEQPLKGRLDGTGADGTTFATSSTPGEIFDPANFQIYACRTSAGSDNVFFKLASANYPSPFQIEAETTLTSSIFPDVYDNSRWQLSVRVRPQTTGTGSIYPLAGWVSGATAATDYNYEVIFRGLNTYLGEIQNSFEVTGAMSWTSGSNFLQSAKRIYVGAERTNITGALLNVSDVKVAGLKAFTKALDNNSLDQHVFDIGNMGLSASYQNVSPLDINIGHYLDVTNAHMLALDWNFNNVSGGSDSSGNFYVTDMSSGSAELRDNYGWIGKETGYQHTGYGQHFPASTKEVISRELVNAFQFVDPEQAISSDMIQILSDDDTVFGVEETVPSYYYTLEKSMYGAISESMLDFFAGVVDFNNVIGAAVNRYRDRYKALEKLREAFFRKVSVKSDIEKYVEYYKWFDDTISTVVSQMIPASAEFEGDVMNTIESHVLERNKYQSKFPTLEFVEPDLDTALQGVKAASYPYKQGSSTVPASPRSTKQHELFWKQRALRSSPEITSGDANIDAQREIYRKTIYSTPHMSQSYPVAFTKAGVVYKPKAYEKRTFGQPYTLSLVNPTQNSASTMGGGVNFGPHKNIHFTYAALRPFGPVNTAGGVFVPQNLLFANTEDLVALQELDMTDSNPSENKIKRTIKVQHGRNWENGAGYFNVKSSMAFPFNIMSSSVRGGYNKEVIDRVTASISITNLHNDVYGGNMEVPMQGPFTDYAVGGHQSRHVRVNTGSAAGLTDNFRNRPEAWKLLLGKCENVTGALGMVSVDYPWPEIGQEPAPSTGTVTLTSNPSIGDSVTVGDGDGTLQFEIPMENDKAMLFQDRAKSWLALSGDLSASYGLSSGHPLDYFHIEKGTITAWFRADRTTGTGYIFAAGIPQATMDFAVRSDNTLRLTQMWYNADGGANVNAFWDTDAAVITDDVWHHVAVTYDATTTGSIEPVFFVDGVIKDSSAGTAVPTTAGSQLQLRRKVEGTLSGCGACRVITAIGGYNGHVAVSGALDEVAIWQLSMSAEEITEVYATGSVTNLFKVSTYESDSANLYAWYRMGDDSNDAIDGDGEYELGVNSIVDQTGRVNGNPGDVATPSMSFTTNVVTASAGGGGTISWTRGGGTEATVVNLADAINAQYVSGNLAVTASVAGADVDLENSKYGVTGAPKYLMNGAKGNVALAKSGDGITVSGMAGGRDPKVMNYNVPRAVYYRDFTAKRPVNIRNIQMKTGSTILGNYEKNYQVVNSVGAFSNPRSFIENQPKIPTTITSKLNLSGTDMVSTLLNLNRSNAQYPAAATFPLASASYFDFDLEYTVNADTGSDNKSIIISRFGAPGGRETMGRGFQDFRSTEFSVYNTINNRNLTVRRPSQPPSGTLTVTSSQIRVFDIHGKDVGLTPHLARHSARFGRSYLYAPAPGTSYDEAPNFHKVNRNPLRRIAQVGYSQSLWQDVVGTNVEYTIQPSHSSDVQYDNWFVQHPIPRNDKQYSWVTGSIVMEVSADGQPDENDFFTNNYQFYGMAQTWGPQAGLRSSSAEGFVAFFNYVTSSAIQPRAGKTTPGGSARYTRTSAPFASGGLLQTFALNTYTLDPLTASANTLGYPNDLLTAGGPRSFSVDPARDWAAYTNYHLLANATSAPDITCSVLQSGDAIPSAGAANYLNLLLTRRRSYFGWNWTATHQQDHPILRNEYKKNTISVVSASNGNISHYRLSPVSMRGRPVLVNFDDTEGNSTTLRMTNNNEEIFFNDRNFNNIQNISLDEIITPYEQIVPMLRDGAGYTLNWVLYTQNVFPSLRNAFSSSVTSKPSYSNEYWRNALSDRLITGSQGAPVDGVGECANIKGDKQGLNSFGLNVSQSSWPLDAPKEFLTRLSASVPRSDGINNPPTLRALDPSGELQNHYVYCVPPEDWTMNAQIRADHTNPHYVVAPGYGPAQGYTIPGAVYARPHFLAGVTSVVSPTGVRIPETGSLTSSFPVTGCLTTQIYAGEALWEANTQAGILAPNPAGTASYIYELTASNPWYDNYNDFDYEPKLIAKDYAVVPEFRISEHVKDYLKDGLFNENKFDTFGIPGTLHNSRTASFYKEYTNSEFMKDFLKVKTDSGLKGAEIKLECHAVIKLNPYKDFYPAQRTLNMVSEFSSSYVDGIVNSYGAGTGSLGGFRMISDVRTAGLNRPLLQPFFAPGILYNTIKSGIAVDFPVVTETDKIIRQRIWSGDDTQVSANRNFVSPPAGLWASWAASSGSVEPDPGSIDAIPVAGWNNTGSFFDMRIPFEGIITPEKYLRDNQFVDMEAHPSASLPNTTASWAGTVDAPTSYTLMARNFFGAASEFYLKDGEPTKLESGIIGEDLQFASGSIYAARLKMRRSMKGTRTYNRDFYPIYAAMSGSGPWTTDGARNIVGGKMLTATDPDVFAGTHPTYGSGSFVVPQDPNNNPEYRETFTMYSRPTAFGPSFAGRPFRTGSSSREFISGSAFSGTMDCFNGYNWAFTPPYYHGESWVDFIFKPTSSVSYNLERILAEIETVYWRVDAGCPLFTFRAARQLAAPAYARGGTGGAPNGSNIDTVFYNGETPLVADFSNTNTGVRYDGAVLSQARNSWPVYAGRGINDNAMQISASLNLFGMESVFFEEKDKFGNVIAQRNTPIGQKWIIKPKFETPMLNFNDEGARPITDADGTLTLPTFASASVPRGMWHQFGTIPDSLEKGVFVEIGDIPPTWLQNHWKVVNFDSVYNNNAANVLGPEMYSKYQSLSKLVGFDRTESNVRLGEIAESRTIKEGVVAIPYIVESVEKPQDLSGDLLFERKKFIEIPKQRYEAAVSFAQGTAGGDSLQAAGPSIRKLVQSMKNFVLPPQFDFINNPTVKPIVMYIFEFEYKFDRDDLSYMWQNLAPRKSRTMKLEKSSISHNLMDLELLNEDNIMDNANLRWMVFKVKQKATTDYYDLVPKQAGGAEAPPKASRAANQGIDSTYEVGYNWPYDYLSFVEKIKMDAQVLYKSDRPTAATPSGPEGGGMPLEGTPEAFTGEVIGGTFGGGGIGGGGATPTPGAENPGRSPTRTPTRERTERRDPEPRRERPTRTRRAPRRRPAPGRGRGGGDEGGGGDGGGYGG